MRPVTSPSSLRRSTVAAVAVYGTTLPSMVTRWCVTAALGTGLSASAFLSASFASSAARTAGAPSARASAKRASGRAVDLIRKGSSSETGGLQPPDDGRREGDAVVGECVVGRHVHLGDAPVARLLERQGEA